MILCSATKTENNPSIHDKPTLIVNQVMPQDSVGKDFWPIPVLKNLFNIVNISQGLGSSKARLGIRNPVVSIEFCHYLPDKAEKSCSSTFVKQEEGNVPERNWEESLKRKGFLKLCK